MKVVKYEIIQVVFVAPRLNHTLILTEKHLEMGQNGPEDDRKDVLIDK